MKYFNKNGHWQQDILIPKIIPEMDIDCFLANDSKLGEFSESERDAFRKWLTSIRESQGKIQN